MSHVNTRATILNTSAVHVIQVDILVATHAVLTSASTAFQDLGLAVVDEEQRFGVEQRDRLTCAIWLDYEYWKWKMISWRYFGME